MTKQLTLAWRHYFVFNKNTWWSHITNWNALELLELINVHSSAFITRMWDTKLERAHICYIVWNYAKYLQIL